MIHVTVETLTMDTPVGTKTELKSSDSNSVVQRRRFVLELLITYTFCLLLPISAVVYEIFGKYHHFGQVRPVWAYILGGTNAAILVVYVVISLVQLSNRNWRLRSLQKRTVFMREFIAVSLWIILFSSSTFFPVKDQANNIDVSNIVPGYGAGLYMAVMFFALFGLVIVLVFTRVNEAKSKK